MSSAEPSCSTKAVTIIRMIQRTVAAKAASHVVSSPRADWSGAMKAILIALLASAVIVPVASAQQTRQKARAGELASPEQELGKSFRVTPDELPPPKATRSVSNGPLALPFKDQAPKVPEGFTVNLFAKLDHPRRMLVL